MNMDKNKFPKQTLTYLGSVSMIWEERCLPRESFSRYGTSVVSHLSNFGIKKNILRNLANRDVYIKVFPYNASFEDMSAFNPDCYFVSNRPWDPEPLVEAQTVAKEIIKNGKMDALNTALFGYVKNGLNTLPTSEQIYEPDKFFIDERY